MAFQLKWMTVHVTALNWTECVVKEGWIIKKKLVCQMKAENIRILLIAIFLNLYIGTLSRTYVGMCARQPTCNVKIIRNPKSGCLFNICCCWNAIRLSASKLLQVGILVWSNRWCNPAIQPIITAGIKLVDGAGNWLVSLVNCDEKSIFFIQKNGSCCTMMTR